MKMKEPVDLTAFLDATEKCRGDIFLHTVKGDILNVKSLLTRYATISMYSPRELRDARVICTNEDDYASLAEYLQPDPDEIE